MVPLIATGLTRIGFRRDVKLFLTALVGFLVVMILGLLLLLQTTVENAGTVIHDSHVRAASIAARDYDAAPPSSDNDIAPRLDSLRSRYAIAAIEVRLGTKDFLSGLRPLPRSAEKIERSLGAGTATFWFDLSEIAAMRNKARLVAIICLVATASGALLLFLYVPRILHPIESMLDHANEVGERKEGMDEAHFVIETFRNSIAKLKAQEIELKRLHDVEKTRADELERITATLTRSLTSGFIALDAAGHIVDINAAARDILRLLPGTPVVGLRASEAFGPTAFATLIDRSCATRMTMAREEIEEVRGDETRTIGLSTVPLIGESGASLGMLALFTDLTPIRELQSRVRDMRMLADLGEIATGIAHEFRNSLSTVLGYVRLARREPLPAEAENRLQSAEDEAQLLAGAVDGLLQFARPIALDRQKLDLLEIVEKTTERLRTTLAVEIVVEGEPTHTEGDPALLARAIENLVRNAAESIERKGGKGRVEITVSATPSPRIEIRDEGVGIDPQDASRLFLPFQSDRPGGFGLGLPLARKIILLHGGKVRLEGQPGRGATATIEL